MKKRLFVIEKYIDGKWKPLNFWAGNFRAAIGLHGPNTRVRRVKSVVEALQLSNPNISFLDLTHLIARGDGKKYEWLR